MRVIGMRTDDSRIERPDKLVRTYQKVLTRCLEEFIILRHLSPSRTDEMAGTSSA